jgi:hypothetical protein
VGGILSRHGCDTITRQRTERISGITSTASELRETRSTLHTPPQQRRGMPWIQLLQAGRMGTGLMRPPLDSTLDDRTPTLLILPDQDPSSFHFIKRTRISAVWLPTVINTVCGLISRSTITAHANMI